MLCVKNIGSLSLLRAKTKRRCHKKLSFILTLYDNRNPGYHSDEGNFETQLFYIVQSITRLFIVPYTRYFFKMVPL